MVKNIYAARRAMQGYLAPSQRDGCRNCAHRSVSGLALDQDRPDAYECTIGRFLVSPGGICRQYQLRFGVSPRKETK